MEYPSFDILANLPEIDACMTKLQGILIQTETRTTILKFWVNEVFGLLC